MSLDAFIGIAGFVFLVLCHIGMRHASKYVYLKYKD